MSALATARTNALLATHHTVPDALVGGYTRALLGAAIFVCTVVFIGLRAANTKGEPPGGLPAEKHRKLIWSARYGRRCSTGAISNGNWGRV